MTPVRVLVVDDSAFMRRRLVGILESAPDLVVAGIARDGEEAVARVRELEPDVMTLDINMPRMDGLTALTYIMMERPTPAVVVSSLTQEGALTTLEALELGAVDYVPKPSGTVSLDINSQAQEIVAKVRAAARARIGRRRSSATLRRQAGLGSRAGRSERVARVDGDDGDRPEQPARLRRGPARSPARPATTRTRAAAIVAVGVSTGGPQTLLDILPALPPDLPVPVVLVQHMPPHFTRSFADRLDQVCAVRVKEAEHSEPLQAGTVYVAPGGTHLTVAESVTGAGPRARLVDRPRDVAFCPSVDVLFESVARTFGAHSVGVLLTGMGSDGADGMVRIRRAGGATIAESEETAVVFGMPREAIARGGAAVVAPAGSVAFEIMRALRERVR